MIKFGYNEEKSKSVKYQKTQALNFDEEFTFEM